MLINTYIITCDKTSWILNSTIHLIEKYWNLPKNFKIVGFQKPDIKLESGYEFISIKNKQESIDDWSKDILSVIEKDKNEFIILTLDDFLPNNYTNIDVYDKLVSLMKNDTNIVRCALGSYIQHHKHKIVGTNDEFNIIEIDQNADYRLSAQPSIWRKDYLMYWLSRSKNPWHFETAISPSDGKRILGTTNKHAFNYIIESAISGGRHGDMVNVLGLGFDDIKELIELKLIDENKLQYGIFVGKVPLFIEFKYKFSINKLNLFINNRLLNIYKSRYAHLYK